MRPGTHAHARPGRIAPAVLAAGLLAIAVAACKGDAVTVEKFDPVDDRTSTEMAHRYVAAFEDCGSGRLRDLIDVESIALRGVADARAPAAAKRSFAKGAAQGATLTRMCEQVEDGSVRFLRIQQRGGDRRAVVRVLIADGGVSYHELLVGKSRKDGRVKVRDVYLMMTGQSLSETMGEMFRQLAPEARAGRLDQQVSAMRAIQRLLREGDAAGAMAELESLSPALLETKQLLLIRVQLASMIDEDTYLAAIERYERTFPGDPSMNLVSIDGHFLREDWPAALRSIDAVDRDVGGDPYLDSVRAGVLIEQGDGPGAVAAARRWVDAEPDMASAWQNLFVMQARSGAHADAVATLGELDRRFDLQYDTDELASDPLFAAFVASEPFRTWNEAE